VPYLTLLIPAEDYQAKRTHRLSRLFEFRTFLSRNICAGFKQKDRTRNTTTRSTKDVAGFECPDAVYRITTGYYFPAYQSFPGGDNGHRNRHETGFYLIFERRAANVIKRGQKARRSKFVWTKKHISGRVWVLLTINYVGN
jgi:hypothetical protein